MLVDFGILAVGLALLLGGGEALVRGASALAARSGISPVLIGLTVVAFGTSSPELVVSLAAALHGNTEIAFGNVVGSNIANVGLLLAVGALIRPIAIHRTLIVREIPMMIAASLAMLVLGTGGWIGGDGAGFVRADGLVLLLMFGVFMYYTITAALGDRSRHRNGVEGDPVPVGMGTGAAVGMVLLGLIALVAGGEATVRSASALAADFGVGEAFIGLTIVAVGTSLPELATTLSAGRLGQGDLAVGNIVGSNIFNLLLVWALSATMVPAALPTGGTASLVVMTAFALAVLPMAVSRRKMGRVEGLLLLTGYVGYIAWLVIAS